MLVPNACEKRRAGPALAFRGSRDGMPLGPLQHLGQACRAQQITVSIGGQDRRFPSIHLALIQTRRYRQLCRSCTTYKLAIVSSIVKSDMLTRNGVAGEWAGPGGARSERIAGAGFRRFIFRVASCGPAAKLGGMKGLAEGLGQVSVMEVASVRATQSGRLPRWD
jgi:hypothetical protein